MAFSEKYGPWALVTGASSGIGLEFARQLAAKGLNLVLVARRIERLAEISAELTTTYGIQVRLAPIDLARADFLPELMAVSAEIEIGLLINNAGYSQTGDLLDGTLEDDLAMLYTNARAPLMLAHAYGAPMRARRRGGIIFVSSVAAYAPIPFWTHYSATKVYDLHLAEGLAGELAPDNVDVLVLCPGTTRTEFLERANMNPFMALDADRVVAAALKGLGHKRRVVPGFTYQLGVWLTRFLPNRVNSAIFSRIIHGMHRG